MKYVVIFLFVLSFFACKKDQNPATPPADDSTVTVPRDTTVARVYAGRYVSREIYDDPFLSSYYLDTAFQDTMIVTFLDSVNVRCKLYTYTIFHSESPNHPGAAGKDSLEFTCRIAPPPFIPVKGGSIRFTPGRDSVYFSDYFASGQVGYYHSSSFAGRRQ